MIEELVEESSDSELASYIELIVRSFSVSREFDVVPMMSVLSEGFGASRELYVVLWGIMIGQHELV